jgi:broad specificity phosphatase PhoE
MKLILVRHGEMTGDPFVTPSPPVDGCLSDRGVRQAETLAECLRASHIDHVLCSSYGRAIQTAEIALAGRDIPLEICHFLREWEPNRDLADLPDTDFEAIQKQHAELFAEETWHTEMGEGCYDMYARIIPPFLAKLADLGIRPGQGGFVPEKRVRHLVVAVFAHGGSLNILLSHLLGVQPFPIAAFNFALTGMATVEFVERQGIHYPCLRIPAGNGNHPGLES